MDLESKVSARRSPCILIGAMDEWANATRARNCASGLYHDDLFLVSLLLCTQPCFGDFNK